MTRRILVAEDEPLLNELVVSVVKDSFRGDAYVDIAFDGEDALKKVAESYYDLIVLDIKMPKLMGTQIIEMIRYTPNAITPVIVVSAFYTAEITNELTSESKTAPFTFLQKPFTFDQLTTVVQSFTVGLELAPAIELEIVES